MGRRVAIAVWAVFLLSPYSTGQQTQSDASKSQPSHTSHTQEGLEPLVLNGISIPSDFPHMEVLVSDDPAPGYIFLNNWGGPPYNMILDNSGVPVWYLKTIDRRRDFKLQPNGLLTMVVRTGYGGVAYLALDSTFTETAVLRAENPYWTDEHELTMLEDGSYYLIGRTEYEANMDELCPGIGARSKATLRETAIQGFSPENDLVFQWRARDHFNVCDLEIEDLTGGYIRFPHMNAVSVDDDGNVLVSSRHLSEVTKINRETGEIMWRLSGKSNQFTFIDDPFNGFRNQHDIRALGDSRYTVFDNGNGHDPPETRAVEYDIDPVNMTATLVWQYRHDPRRYTSWMGNAQRLPGGNTLINYADASLPKVTEIRPDGSKALEMDFVKSAHSYRAFKFDWMGKADVPYLLIESHPTHVALLFNKFGDEAVDFYRVYGGKTEAPTTLMATTEEPFVVLTELDNRTYYFFRVTAVDTTGGESGFSNEEHVFVRYVERGMEMVANNGFLDGSEFWEFEEREGAQAALHTDDGEAHIEIVQGGTAFHHVHMRQPDIPLIQGHSYRFEFDAKADSKRFFDAKVAQAEEPWKNYSKIGPTFLTSSYERYSYDFTMEDPTDFRARIVLNAGKSDIDVYIDYVSLIDLAPATDADDSTPEVASTALLPAFPNPFSTRTRIPFALEAPGMVTLEVYDTAGRRVDLLAAGLFSGGQHSLSYGPESLPSGVYFGRLTASLAGSRTVDVGTNRLIYLK